VEEVIFLSSVLLTSLGGFNPSKTRYATPYDSTQGVGAGFYLFGIAVLVLFVLGVLKAFFDDRRWRGKSIQPNFKKRRS
jgi:hypothetical protein